MPFGYMKRSCDYCLALLEKAAAAGCLLASTAAIIDASGKIVGKHRQMRIHLMILRAERKACALHPGDLGFQNS